MAKTSEKNNTDKIYDVCIIGGGIAGLVQAILLAEGGVSVALVDPYPPKSVANTDITGRTVALMNSSINLLKTACVWSVVEPYACPLQTMRLIDTSATKSDPQDFDAADIGLEQFGFNIPNALLRAELFEKAQTYQNINLYTPERLFDYEAHPSHVLARLDGGAKIKSRLLIGADGKRSAVRSIAGIKADITEYGQHAITCVINHSKSHNFVATEFHRPAGPLAFVPMPQNQSSVVWVERAEDANAVMALSKDSFINRLEGLSQNILGGITLQTSPESWPLSSFHAKQLSASRIALIAEAAHVMSPVTAQGLNLSLRDVASLTETIIDSMRLGMDAGAPYILSQYKKRRGFDIKTRVLGVDGMHRLVKTENKAFQYLRRTGMKSVARISPIKNIAMHIGLAPALDEGRLLRGEAV